MGCQADLKVMIVMRRIRIGFDYLTRTRTRRGVTEMLDAGVVIRERGDPNV